MHTLRLYILRFVALFACVWVASLTTGCGASYEIKATASYLPSQAETDRLAVPADLLKTLNDVLASSDALSIRIFGGLGAEPLGQSLWRSQRDCETQRRAPIENQKLA